MSAKVIVLVFIVAVVFGSTIAGIKSCTKKEDPKEAQIERQSEADLVISEIGYGRDAKTNICYAYNDPRAANDRKLSIMVVPCEKIPPRLFAQARRGDMSDIFKNHLKYAKDARTDICYAYYSGFGNYGKQTAVPCEKIQPELLVVSIIK